MQGSLLDAFPLLEVFIAREKSSADFYLLWVFYFAIHTTLHKSFGISSLEVVRFEKDVSSFLISFLMSTI